MIRSYIEEYRPRCRARAGPAYGVYTTPDKKTLYLTLGPPAQGAVAVLDVKTLTITGNITDTDLNQPRAVRFPHY